MIKEAILSQFPEVEFKYNTLISKSYDAHFVDEKQIIYVWNKLECDVFVTRIQYSDPELLNKLKMYLC